MITEDTAWLLVEACRWLNKPSREMSVCELGNQVSGWKFTASVKKILTWLGMQHISIDMNGLDGAEKWDLSKPMPAAFLERFDLVTNAGTTEHVCTTNDFHDQWQAFYNIHAMCKPRAVIMHVLPNPKGFHCGCGYAYEHLFFTKLARACDYKVLEFYDSKTDANHTVLLMLKTPSSTFPRLNEFLALGGILKACK